MQSYPGAFLFVSAYLALSPWCSAFEQGSYHLIDLVESAEAAPAPGRVAVPLSILSDQQNLPATEINNAQTAISPISTSAELGSFGIGFNHAGSPVSFGATDRSGGFSDPMLRAKEAAFELTSPPRLPEIGVENGITDFSSGAFQPDTRRTVFGD